jgi:hypothetical protein
MTAPWGFASRPASEVAPILAPGKGHVVIFHLVTEGRAVVRVEGEPDLHLEAGDIVIMPHGDAHVFANGAPEVLQDGEEGIRRFLAGDIGVTRYGGGGELTRFVCGYFGCEQRACRLFLAGLPRVIKVNVRGDASGAWLETSLRYLVAEAASATR